MMRLLLKRSVLDRLALASLVANVAIVVTGGAVRLSGSGLGCPTFPTCTSDSLTPVASNGLHGIIEFTNRQLSVLLALIALATLIAAWRQHRQRRLAAIAFAGIPVQALLGGITVLTGLNPWTVGAHFLLSMVVIGIALLLWTRLTAAPVSTPLPAPHPVAVLARLLVVLTAAVLTVGTVVTGAGPHAGDADTPRNGLDPAGLSQVHADLVMALVGLTVGLVVLVRAVVVAERVRRDARILLAVLLAQGVLGYTQYFLDVPALLVALHMLGACLVWIAALRVLLALEEPADRVDDEADQRADHRPVHPDELKVTTDL